MPSPRSKHRSMGSALLAGLVLAGAGAVELRMDRADTLDRVRAMTGGDPARGKHVIAEKGCGACHEVPGVPQAIGKVGPPLKGVSARVYLAGRLVNTPQNLTRWIRDPKSIDSLTAMPALGLTEQEARDAAAYLYAN